MGREVDIADIVFWCIAAGIVIGVGIPCVRNILNKGETSVVNVSTNDTILVTGVSRQPLIIQGLDKYNNEYTLSHLRNRSKEIFFVHPKDTVVVHREFRNGEHVPYSDSLVVNLTRQKMIKSIKERNLSK